MNFNTPVCENYEQMLLGYATFMITFKLHYWVEGIKKFNKILHISKSSLKLNQLLTIRGQITRLEVGVGLYYLLQ
jgi:hypothetical protein